MTYKQKIIEFVKLKNAIIEDLTGVNYITLQDITDIQKWLEDSCERIYKRLEYVIFKESIHGVYTDACPWCIKYGVHCYSCEYKTNHGRCGEKDSLFVKYKKPGVDTLFSNVTYRGILRKIEEMS